MADTLLQTLFCATHLDKIVFNGIDGPDNTPAGTHDGNDATCDVATLGLGVSAATMRYTLDDLIHKAVSISFLRFKARARGLGGSDFWIVAFGDPTPFESTPIAITPVFADYQTDAPLDGDGNPWNPQTIGSFILGNALQHSVAASSEVRLSEISVEVWGTPISTGVTSYQNMARPGLRGELPLEAQARIRAGDQRYRHGQV